MSKLSLNRWSGVSLIIAGLATAAFWLLVIPFENFAGAEAPLHPLFTPGQVFHIIGAIFAVFGYVGLYLRQRESTGWLGFVGYFLATVGAMFFLADAMIGIVVFPVLAEFAPELTDASGPMFTGRVLGYYIMFAATNMIGIVLLGLATLRGGMFPKIAAILFILGGILFNLPPIPALHYLLVAGGVIWGIGALWLGNAVRTQDA